uniref:Uncharacterized protein n=1 Tax=Romanomermis culicivorax TaxID=13658 RepID=A0A915IUM8_ROMCU
MHVDMNKQTRIKSASAVDKTKSSKLAFSAVIVEHTNDRQHFVAVTVRRTSDFWKQFLQNFGANFENAISPYYQRTTCPSICINKNSNLVLMDITLAKEVHSVQDSMGYAD